MRLTTIITFVTFGIVLSSSAYAIKSQVTKSSDNFLSRVFTEELFRKFLKIDLQKSYSARPDSATLINRRPLDYEGQEFVIFYHVVYKMYDSHGNFISDLVVRVESDYSVKEYQTKRLKPYRDFLEGRLEIKFIHLRDICAAHGYNIGLCTLSLERKKGKYIWKVEQPHKLNSFDELIIDARNGKVIESNHWVVQY